MTWIDWWAKTAIQPDKFIYILYKMSELVTSSNDTMKLIRIFSTISNLSNIIWISEQVSVERNGFASCSLGKQLSNNDWMTNFLIRSHRCASISSFVIILLVLKTLNLGDVNIVNNQKFWSIDSDVSPLHSTWKKKRMIELLLLFLT